MKKELIFGTTLIAALLLSSFVTAHRPIVQVQYAPSFGAVYGVIPTGSMYSPPDPYNYPSRIQEFSYRTNQPPYYQTNYQQTNNYEQNRRLWDSLPDDIDTSKLPVSNIYDPKTNTNRKITKYTYGQLTTLLNNQEFVKKNNVVKVCATIEILFGQTPCIKQAQQPATHNTRSYIEPPTVYIKHTTPIITGPFSDPLSYPWPAYGIW